MLSDPSRIKVDSDVITFKEVGSSCVRKLELLKYSREKRAVGKVKSGPRPTWKEK